MRKTHPDLWLLKAEAEDRASKVGLIAQSPCKYCGATVKQPRAHLKHCGSVFQASLYALAVAQDHDDRGGRRDGGSARAGGHLSWVGQVQDATTGGDGGAGIHGEVSSPGSQRRLRQGPERLGQAVAGDWGKPSQEAKASSNQEEMGELVKLLSKMVLKLEDENARLRTECGFILYLDTGEHGNRAGVYKHGWMKDGDVALDPLWTIMRWDPEKQQQVESTTESPLRHSKVLELIDCLRRTIPQDCAPEIPLDSPHGGILREPGVTLLDDDRSPLNPGGAGVRCSLRPDRLFSAEDASPPRATRSKVLATTFQNSSLCDWKKREDRWQSRSTGPTRWTQRRSIREGGGERLIEAPARDAVASDRVDRFWTARHQGHSSFLVPPSPIPLIFAI